MLLVLLLLLILLLLLLLLGKPSLALAHAAITIRALHMGVLMRTLSTARKCVVWRGNKQCGCCCCGYCCSVC